MLHLFSNRMAFYNHYQFHQVKRKITLRQAYRKPWCVNAKEKINKEVFGVLYEALLNFSPKVGFNIEETWYKTTKNIKTVTVTFTCAGIFVHHLSRVTNDSLDVPSCFRKSFKCKSRAAVRVDDDKPATIHYSYSTETIVEVHKRIWNFNQFLMFIFVLYFCIFVLYNLACVSYNALVW